MYTKRLLTPEELTVVDPTSFGESALAAFHGNKPNPSNQQDYKFNDHVFEQFLSKATTVRGHEEYLEWNKSYLSKTGRQGGTGNMEFLYSAIESTYTLASRTVEVPNEIEEAVNYLIARLSLKMKQLDINYQPILTPDYKHTNSGLNCGGKKGYFVSESSFNVNRSMRHLQPAVPGFRRTKGKPRIIYQDAISNVRLIEPILKGVKRLLLRVIPEYFPKWVNDGILLAPRLTREVQQNKYFIEFDYYHMDEHFSSTVVNKIILPLYGAVLPPAEDLIFRQYIDEMWDQPLLIGDILITGTHNFFSGQPPTNDFETVVSVVIPIAAALRVGVNPKLLSIYPMGDDLAVSCLTKRQQELIAQAMHDIANQMGLVAHPDKIGLNRGCVKFCKKMYYPAGPKRDGVLLGAYPSILALNSIYNPESMSNRPGQRAVADLQRLSNCEGSPDFTHLCQFVGTNRVNRDWTFTEEDITAYAVKDWWYRLYGETFNPLSSPAFKILFKNNLIK